MEQLAAIILQIFILLLFAKIVGGVFERFRMPKLIGEIIAGAIFINLIIFVPAFADLLNFSILEFNGEMEDGSPSFFHIMGEVGIIFLLFSVGLETKLSDMKKVGKNALYIAILGVLIPFAGGMLFIFYGNISFNAALLIGAALFGTSTAVGVECLRNMNAMDTMEAKLIVSATIIDDILCLSLLGVIMSVIQPGASTAVIVINTAIVAIFVIFMFFFVSRVKKMADRRKIRIQKLQNRIDIRRGIDPATRKGPKPIGELSALGVAVLVCLGLAALSVNIGLAAIIGAFLAGMIFAEFKDTFPVEHNFNVIVYFMLPFFFVWVGMELQLDKINIGILPLLAAVLFVAVATKYAAGYIGGRMGKLPKDSCHLIGVISMPRGEVGIIVATIGLSSEVFNYDLFTVIILMALITSVIVPPLVTHAYRKMEKNRAEANAEA
ncbi:MAG: cation:proton antiporter [Methanomassiliicoccaceae archaeon]|jgi:Kef-type K+ transport system membrane component KefB|nr:cation:proton antiporter [Methanomassiliicoccaceae archaeon]